MIHSKNYARNSAKHVGRQIDEFRELFYFNPVNILTLDRRYGYPVIPKWHSPYHPFSIVV